VGWPNGAGPLTTFFVTFFALGNFLEGILADWLAGLLDESLRLAVGNFAEAIFLLAVENLLDGIFAMTLSF